MTVLTQAIAIGDNEIHIDSALAAGQVPGYVQIDDELLNVGGQDNLAGKTLTLSTPAKEAHDNGATVTYAGRPFDPTFKTALAGDSGGEQTIRLIKLTVAFDDPLVDDDYNFFFTAERECLVVYSACYIRVPFDGTALSVTFEGNVNGTDSFIQYSQTTPGSAPREPFAPGDGNLGEVPTYRQIRPLSDGDQVGFAVWPQGGGLTAGEVDFYVLIAEPAA